MVVLKLDFKIDDFGELIPDEEVEGNEYRLQQVKCRIKSIKENWFVDKTGCDIEKYFGAFVTPQIKAITTEVIDNLVEKNLIDKTDIYISIENDYKSVSNRMKVHLKDSDYNKTYDILDVRLNIFK